MIMFVNTDIESVLKYLNNLKEDSKAEWGKMSAQRMVEHLTDTVRIATGENPQELLIPEEKIEKMQSFLSSDKEMAKNIQVPFALENTSIRLSELELAVDELVEELIYFDELYSNNEGLTQIHPYYGALDYDQWKRLNSKHLTHHFKQFSLLK